MKLTYPLGGWLPVFLLLSFQQTLSAQYSISGSVQDAESNALAYSNVLLLNASDSAFIKGNIVDDQGNYDFDNIQEGAYLIQVTMVGYQELYSEMIRVNQQTPLVQVPALQLESAAEILDEVVVTEKRAMFEQKIDRLVVNVDNSIVLSGTNALEVLKRSPGVSVNPQSNSITMSGKDEVIVMINGKISRMPTEAVVQMLAGMSSDNIERLELIHTPPANFDAEGNAGFINIVLKKTQDDGLNGSFAVNAGYGKKEKAGANFNLNFRKKIVNLFGDYSWNYNNNPQLFSNYRGFQQDGKFIETGGDSFRDPTRQHTQNARLGIDIQLNPKTVVGALTTWTNRYWTMDAVNFIDNKIDGELINQYVIPNDEISRNRTFVSNINLQHKFNEKQQLNIDLDYANFKNENPSNYQNDLFDPSGQLLETSSVRVSKETPLNIWVGKIDYKHSFTENIIWEVGAKMTNSTFDNDVLVENFENDAWTVAPLFSSIATMTEDVAATYTALSFKINDKTDFKAGLRYEYADINLGTIEEPNIVDRTNGRFFPSLFISNQINEDNKVQFSYSRRINRPSFNQLAPWFIFFDPNTIMTGNPTLRASLSDAIRGTYSWKTLQVDAQYTYTKNMIGQFQPDVDTETNTFIGGAKNFPDGHLASIGITFPYTINKWWEIRSSWTGQWAKVNDNIDDQTVSFTNTTWYMNGNSTFKLPKSFSLEVNLVYFAPSLFGAVVWQSFNNVDIGIQKELKNGNGFLKFVVSDLFLGGNWDGNLTDDNVDFVYNGYYGFAERVFRLSYSRNFGNNKLKRQRQRAMGSQEEQQRVD